MRLFRKTARVTAYRTQPGTPGGFVNKNPGFFDQLPNATVIEDLRITFKIEKNLSSEPNTCEMTITNLAAVSRADLEKKPLIVRIDAGYDGVAKHLFLGDLRWGFSKLDGVNWETTLQMADGDRAYRFARVNRSYKAHTPVVQVIKDIVKTMGLATPSGAELGTAASIDAQFATGGSMQGPARDELARLLAPYGYHFSTQDGKLQILRDEEARADQASVISADNGMIGSPQRAAPDKSGKPQMTTAKMLLYPELTPGQKVQILSKTVNGIFRLERVTHDGDTHSKDTWTTEIEAKPL